MYNSPSDGPGIKILSNRVGKILGKVKLCLVFLDQFKAR